jgi:Kef-type K+ transport system membrane component KefB
MPDVEATQLGAGMIARGEVTLIIAAAGSSSGLLSAGAFSAIVVAVLVSTLVTPSILHLAFSRLKPKVRLQAEEEASEE